LSDAPIEEEASEESGPEGPPVLTVSELVAACTDLLDEFFGDVWVEGEISGLKIHISGHMYFALRDDDAQISCVCFRREARSLKFEPEEGLKVRCHGRVSIYAARGAFQLYVDTMEPAGLGAQALALEQLKKKLQMEGLFDVERKRPLPFWPRVIGVVTSPTGAAIQDIIRVTHRRAATRIVIAPTQVQGAEAPAQIVAALAAIQRLPEVEVVIVARGGGAAEDLAAFNDEQVARAIAACRVPVISAVGHEIDVTIADLVADLRAATPSQAGERVVPVQAELEEALSVLQERLVRALERRLREDRRTMEHLWHRLCSGGERRILDGKMRLQEWERRLAAAHPAKRLERDRATLSLLGERLERCSPRARIASLRAVLLALNERLRAAGIEAVKTRRAKFTARVAALSAMSPLAVLERGYSLVRRQDGSLVRDAATVSVGEHLFVRLARGELGCTVTATSAGESEDQPARPPERMKP